MDKNMREILFRAKRVDNGEWVEGFYSQLPKPSLGATIITNGDLCAEDVSDYIIVNQCKQHSIFSNGYPLEVVECEYYEIDSETLCQYTGLTDKNGKRIWENDIVGAWSEGKHTIGRVKRRVDGLYIIYPSYQKQEFWGLCPDENGKTTVEVIGNILDNPELLQGE